MPRTLPALSFTLLVAVAISAHAQQPVGIDPATMFPEAVGQPAAVAPAPSAAAPAPPVPYTLAPTAATVTPPAAPEPAPATEPEPEPDAFDDGAIYAVVYPDWFKAHFYNLRDDANDAAEAGKQGLFVFFSTEGCSYCHLFIAETLADPTIASRLQAHFDSIGFEIFSDAELTVFDGSTTRVNAFAQANGVQFAPTLLFFDTDGRPLLHLTGYYGPERFSRVLDYLIEQRYADLTLREYLAVERPPGAGTLRPNPLRPDPLFAAPPYALDRHRVPAGRPLLVLFENADCAACATFHDQVLANPAIREALARFEVVRLDAADETTPVVMPGGGRTHPRAWFDAQGFTQTPALVFFDERGREVLATDALVLASRMQSAIGFVEARAWERGWTYQRYARSQAVRKAAEREAAARQAAGAAAGDTAPPLQAPAPAPVPAPDGRPAPAVAPAPVAPPN